MVSKNPKLTDPLVKVKRNYERDKERDNERKTGRIEIRSQFMLTYTIYLLLFGALCLNQATVQLAHSSQQHCHQDQSEQSQRCIMESAVVYYFPIRGRGEAVRLALSVAGVPFSSEMADSEELKHDLSKYSFGQMPRYSLCESVAYIYCVYSINSYVNVCSLQARYWR